MTAFLRRTVVGGSLVVLVVGSIGYSLWHALSGIRTILEQVATVLSLDTRFPALAALATLLLLAIACGLLLQTRPARRMIEGGTTWLGDRFPFSKLVHGFERELVGLGKSPVKPALAVLGDHEVLAFVVEELADGRCVVFVPTSPNPSHGNVYIVPRESVHLIDGMHFQVASSVSSWGVGTKKLLESARKPA